MEHAELAAELPNLETLPSADRLRLARKRRQQQLKRYAQYERSLDKEAHKRARRTVLHNGGAAAAAQVDIMVKPSSSRVHFASNIVLLEAAARNDVDEVRRLLDSRVNPDSANEDGLTALHQCCIDDNAEMCRILIQYGANVNARDSEAWTPLHAAATCGHARLCHLLIENGADLLAVNADGNMPYDICEDEETLDYVENEMAKREITQQQIDETRTIPESKMLQDLKYLLTEGHSLNYFDQQGATPMHVAAASGYNTVAEFLLKQQIPTDTEDKDGWQAIHIAAFWGHLGVLELLLYYGADLEAQTKNGETVFDICEDVELRAKLYQIKQEVDEMKRVNSRLQPIRRASTMSMNHRTASIRSVRRSSMREKSLMSRKEAKQEAEMRNSVSDLPSELATTQEEPEMGDTLPPLPQPVGHSQVSMHSAPELKLGNGRSGDASMDGPSYAGAARSVRPVPVPAPQPASAGPSPPTHSAVTNGHYRPVSAADPARKYIAPAPAPASASASVQPQPLPKEMESMMLSEQPLRRFKANKDEVVGKEGSRQSNKKLCCAVM